MAYNLRMTLLDIAFMLVKTFYNKTQTIKQFKLRWQLHLLSVFSAIQAMDFQTMELNV
jgi:hypothetical protein